MKRIFFAAATVATLMGAGAAFADTPGGYVSILGGASFDPHLTYGGLAPSMNTGFNAGARAGVYLDRYLPSLPGLALEVDSFYTQSHYAGLTGASLGSASFMGDLVYHLPINDRWNLYGGAGVGVVDDMLRGSAHGAQTVFGWQGIGGLEYALSPQTSLFTEYRYQNAHDAHIGGLANVGNTSNNVSVGLKFNL